MAAFARRRDEYENGLRKRKVRIVCESLRLMKSNNGGNPAAMKRESRRPWTNVKRFEEEMNSEETRVETAKGRRRRAGVEEK